MKKHLFLFAAAALALASCSSDDTIAENSSVGNQQQEIAFMPLNQKATRAEVEGTTFPAGQDMYVAAYDATEGQDYFAQTTFDEVSSVWKANPPKYWPMNAATLNFLAYTGIPSGSYFNATHPAQDLTITLADNSTNQYDLMYACGRQSRALNTAASNVAMNFKHALALIKFEVKTAADYSYGEEPSKTYPLAITSIVLTGAHYSGTYTIDNSSNYASTSSTYSTLTGTWSLVGTQANVTRTPTFANITTSFQQVGNGILVVPDEDDEAADYTSFTINYTLDGKAYSYVYTPADLDVHQAKKYTFQITMTLNEIIIAPTVTDYVEENNNAVTIQ